MRSVYQKVVVKRELGKQQLCSVFTERLEITFLFLKFRVTRILKLTFLCCRAASVLLSSVCVRTHIMEEIIFEKEERGMTAKRTGS